MVLVRKNNLDSNLGETAPNDGKGPSKGPMIRKYLNFKDFSRIFRNFQEFSRFFRNVKEFSQEFSGI